MKHILFLFSVLLISVALVGCTQTGQKTGYVNCCVKAADGTKKCSSLPFGECKNTVGATVVDKCEDCK
jgi:hypothetical protein